VEPLIYFLPNGRRISSEIAYCVGADCDEKYTICIPTYHRNEKLIQTLHSAFHQTYSGSYSVIVLDNDPENFFSCDKIETPKNVYFRYLRNLENIGMVQNWNALCTIAKSKYFTILCDDDVLDASFLERVDRVISLHPSACYVQLPVTTFQVTPKFSNRSFVDTCVKVGLFDAVFDGINCNIGCMIKKDAAAIQQMFKESEYPSFDHFLAKRIVVSNKSCYRLISNRNGAYYRTCDNVSSGKETKIGFIKVDYPAYIRLLRMHAVYPFFYTFLVNSLTSRQIDKIGLSSDEKCTICEQVKLTKQLKLMYCFGTFLLNVLIKLKRCSAKLFGLHIRYHDAK